MIAGGVVRVDGHVVRGQRVEIQGEVRPIPDVNGGGICSGRRAVVHDVPGEIGFSVRVPGDRYAASERGDGGTERNERNKRNTTE